MVLAFDSTGWAGNYAETLLGESWRDAQTSHRSSGGSEPACRLYPASAADYTKVRPDAIAVVGSIAFGDEAKFKAAISQIDRTDLTEDGVTIFVNSPGGNVFAAWQMAGGMLHARDLDIQTTVIVPAGAICASACVVLFAAASHRVVGIGGMKNGQRIPSAGLYVHTNALNGQETRETLAQSVELARVMKEIGTPDTVLAKLLLTGSREGTRLDGKDLSVWANTTIAPFKD